MILAFVASAAIFSQAADGGSTPLETAQAAFSQADFEACLTALGEGLANAQEDGEQARMFLMQGRCEAALQHDPQVERAFTSALEHDPEARLDPQRVPPNLVALLDTLRGQLKGHLEINTQPPGAEVRVDGQPFGRAPLRRSLPLGPHHIHAATQDGRLAGDDDAVLRPNQTTRVVLGLSPVTPTTPPAAPLPVNISLDVQGGIHPLNGAFLGAGPFVHGHSWFAALHGAVGDRGAADLAVGVRWPELWGPFGVLARVEGGAVFRSRGMVAGGGVAAGAWVSATPRLDFFVEGGLLSYAGASNPASLTLGLRLPLY